MRYVTSLNLFFGELKLGAINSGHLREFQRARLAGSDPFIRKRRPNSGEQPRSLPASAKKVNQEIATLRVILQKANCWIPELESNSEPLEEEVTDIPPALTSDQQQLWLDIAASTEEWRLVYWYSVLAFETAMTTDELRAIRLGDVDLVRRTVRIPNTVSKARGRGRTVPIKSADGLWAVEQLIDRARELGAKAPNHYLFPFRDPPEPFDVTRPMTVSGIKKRWYGVRKAAGMNWFNQKDTRHTAITRWAESGVEPGLMTMWLVPFPLGGSPITCKSHLETIKGDWQQSRKKSTVHRRARAITRCARKSWQQQTAVVLERVSFR
jgi:integrase